MWIIYDWYQNPSTLQRESKKPIWLFIEIIYMSYLDKTYNKYVIKYIYIYIKYNVHKNYNTFIIYIIKK